MRIRLYKIFTSTIFRVGFGLFIGVLSLTLAIRTVNYQEISQALAQADLRFVALALLSVAINMLGKGIRWKVLLGPPGKSIGIDKTTMSLTVGHMLNTIFPARLGELSRAQTIGSMGPGRVFVLGTILVEKILDMLSFAFLFVFLLLLIPLPAWINESGYSFAGVSILIAIVVLFIAFQSERVTIFVNRSSAWLPLPFRSYTLSRFQWGLESLRIIKNRNDLLKLILWSVLIWCTAVLNNYFTLLALNIHLPLTASLLVLIGLQIGISVVSVPGRIGIFEYICVLALSIFGISQSLAVGYGILLHAIVLLPGVLLGILFFWYMGVRIKRNGEMDMNEEEQLVGTQSAQKNL